MWKILLNEKDFNVHYPLLFKLVCVSLVLPMTSVDCERTFSIRTKVKTKNRANLNCFNLNVILNIA